MPHLHNTEQDFWNKVDIQDKDECWNWQGISDANGYGRFRLFDRQYNSHVLAYILTYGELQSELIMHTCHNKLCCNPNHLRDTTFLENNQDNDRAKLSKDQVDKIRDLYKTGNYYQIELAEMFNISPSQIYFITHNLSWKE